MRLRHVAHVFHADLALAVGAEEIQSALAAHLRKPPHQLVRHHDGQRHQLGRFVAGEAEHHALVAGAAGIHAHGDIGRLRLDQVVHAAGVAIESVAGVVVADVLDGAARDARNVHVGRGGDFAGHDAGAGGHQHLARHAAGGIVRQDRVQYGVGNLVGNLIRMAFGDGFRREKVLLMFAKFSSLRCN